MRVFRRNDPRRFWREEVIPGALRRRRLRRVRRALAAPVLAVGRGLAYPWRGLRRAGLRGVEEVLGWLARLGLILSVLGAAGFLAFGMVVFERWPRWLLQPAIWASVGLVGLPLLVVALPAWWVVKELATGCERGVAWRALVPRVLGRGLLSLLGGLCVVLLFLLERVLRPLVWVATVLCRHAERCPVESGDKRR